MNWSTNTFGVQNVQILKFAQHYRHVLAWMDGRLREQRWRPQTMTATCRSMTAKVYLVTVMDTSCGRHWCGRHGLWPSWYRPAVGAVWPASYDINSLCRSLTVRSGTDFKNNGNRNQAGVNSAKRAGPSLEIVFKRAGPKSEGARRIIQVRPAQMLCSDEHYNTTRSGRVVCKKTAVVWVNPLPHGDRPVTFKIIS